VPHFRDFSAKLTWSPETAPVVVLDRRLTFSPNPEQAMVLVELVK
jgi:hypothetical protein